MASKEYLNLTDKEVERGELLSLRIALSVIVHSLLAENENKDAIYTELESAAVQVAADIPIRTIQEPDRQKAYRELLMDRSAAVFRDTKNISREARKKN